MRISKIRCYETPFIITGDNVQAGIPEIPKGICKDKDVGTW